MLSAAVPMAGRRRLLTWAFRVLALLALGYFLSTLAEQWQSVAQWRPTAHQIGVLLALSGGYGVGLFLLAEMWHHLLRAVSGTVVPRRLSYPSYTTTQVAKYIPGNVFHLIGRHAWLAGAGIAHRRLLVATALEAGVLVAAATGIATLFFAYTAITSAPLPLPGPVAAVASQAPVALPIASLIVAAAGVWAWRQPRFRTPMRILPRTMVLAGMFFLWQGAIFAIIVGMFEPGFATLAVAIAAAAWVTGFLVPGAPGGLGIREMVLLLLLGARMAEADAVLSIALARLVTTIGDLVCFALGRGVARYLPSGHAVGGAPEN